MSKKTKIIIPSVAVFIIVATLLAGLYVNALAITEEPPYLWVTASEYSSGKVLPVPIYAVAYVFPNGSFILEAWTFNPTPFVFTTSGLHAYTTAYVPGFGPIWAAYDGVTGFFNSKNPGDIYPFSFGYANVWSGVTYNFTDPDAIGMTVEKETLLQTAPYNLFHYNGTGRNQITITYGFVNSQWSNGTFEDFKFVGVGPAQTITIVQNSVLPYQTVVIPANSTHVWIAVPNWPVYPQEVPPNFPYKNLVKTTNAPLPSWWGSKALQ